MGYLHEYSTVLVVEKEERGLLVPVSKTTPLFLFFLGFSRVRIFPFFLGAEEHVVGLWIRSQIPAEGGIIF